MSYRDADKDALIAKLQKENEELKKVFKNRVPLFRHQHIETKLNGEKISYLFDVLDLGEKRSYSWNIDVAPHKQCGVTYVDILIPENDYNNFLKLTK